MSERSEKEMNRKNLTKVKGLHNFEKSYGMVCQALGRIYKSSIIVRETELEKFLKISQIYLKSTEKPIH